MYFIYKIENKINQKKYIGLTNNIVRRRTRHFTDLKCNRHDNTFLQKEYNIYGVNNFSFEILFEGEVTSQEISDREKEYIALYDSYHNGYNQNEGGNFGPSNGGSHLTQSDIFNILAAVDFMTRPGQTLANLYGVSRTTISRIARGINHSQYKKEYESLSQEEKKAIYDIFKQSCDLGIKRANSSQLFTKRKLTEEQVHLIFLNEELKRPIAIKTLMKKFNIKSSNTIYCVLRHDTYENYWLTYQNLTEFQKQQLATLLRN